MTDPRLTTGQMILAMVKIWKPEYNIQPWQQWILYASILWSAVGINVFGSRYVPLFSKYLRTLANLSEFRQSYLLTDIVYLSLTSLIVTISTLLACAAPDFERASWVFGDTTNSTGWNNKGLVFILCLLNNAYGFMGTDAGAHMSEEIPRPMVNVPKVIVSPRRNKSAYIC